MAKPKPSDELLGKLSAKHLEHQRRVRDGTLPASKAIETMQAVCEGRTMILPRRRIKLPAYDANFPPHEDNKNWGMINDLAKGKKLRFSGDHRRLFDSMCGNCISRNREYQLAVIDPFEAFKSLYHRDVWNLNDWDFNDIATYAAQNGLSYGPVEILPRLISRLLHGETIPGLVSLMVMHTPVPYENDSIACDPNGWPIIHQITWTTPESSLTRVESDQGGILTVTAQRFGHIVSDYAITRGWDFVFCC
jgi:hypothetical protein